MKEVPTTASRNTPTQAPFELGIYSFAELTPDPSTGHMVSPAQRLSDLLEEIELADQVGLDVFGLGEHHRVEFVSSAPAVILSAAAARTKRIRLGSAVTVLSSDDPVRAFQAFATLDLLSNGRAEIVAGRGSFIESFPLFGYDLHDYDSLFAEKLRLLLTIREQEHVTWSGQHRASLDDAGVYPRPLQTPLPVWVGVGGTPESVVRAGTLGLPMALAIIGGQPARFKPLLDLYWDTARQAGHDLSQLAVSINSHGYLADTAQQAIDESFPSVAMVMNRIGRERGWSPLTRQQYEASRALHNHLHLGTADEVAEKILYQYAIFGHQRHLLQLSVGTLPHHQVMHAIELLGTRVAPVVRGEIARRTGGEYSDIRHELTDGRDSQGETNDDTMTCGTACVATYRLGSKSMGVTAAEVMSAAREFSLAELETVLAQLTVLRMRRALETGDVSEPELIRKIQEAVPPALQRRYDQLKAASKARSLTENEHQEFLRLIDLVEHLDAQRLEHLLHLARLREMTPTQVMADLGLNVPAAV